MKQTKKYIITMAALLLSVTIWAQGKFTYIYQLNGASSTAAAAGTISGEISENGTATLTLTPAQGNYINADYITVVKTLNGGNAQTRIGTAENVSITASNANADPSETTTYTFAVEDANYDYEVTANFQSRTNIRSATVALAATSYTYDGQEHKPAVSSVKLGDTALDTNDYTISYADDCTNVGSITVTIAGARTYTGTTTATYSITNATMTVTATGYNGTYDGNAHGVTVTIPEGAVIKYGTTEGTYNLETSPVYTDAGSYTVYYQVTRANYQTVTGSAAVEIAKATPSITFDKQSYSATFGETFTAPTPTTNPEGLTITTTSSSNTQVATIADGVITITGIGETTITVSFAGNNNYEKATASYVLTVNKPKAKTYNLWIGETQVTEDNAEDILDAGNNPELPLYIYNAKNNTLIISKDQRGTAVIESRLPELKVYLLEICKIKRIFYNNLDDEANTGTLTFTCNGNVPGKLYIENNEDKSAITGFSDVSYEYQLTAIEPDSTVYRNGQMMYAEKDEEGNPTGNFIVANKVTIGQTIVPTTKEETITFSEDQLVEKDEEGNVKTDEEGNPISADLSNFTYAPTSETGEDSQPKILITLNPESGDGYGDDDGEGGIYVVNGTSDDKVNEVADGVANEEYVPGGSTYAANYDGFTFILPAGEGSVTIDEEVDEGYEFHLKIGTDAPITLKEGEPGRAQAEISFSVEEPTYCYLYMVEAHTYARAAARPYDDTRVGKRPQAHGKIFSVKVSPSKLNAANTPSQASGGVIPPSQEQGDIMELEGIQGVKVVQTTDDRWFTIDGRQIDKPTKKGLYIHNRKKVVVK